MLLAAADEGDLHLVVVDDAAEVVERDAVGAQHHEVVEIVVRLGDAPDDEIVERVGAAAARHLEAHHRRLAGRRVCALAAQAVVLPARILRSGAPRVQLLLRAEAAVGLTGGDQLRAVLRVRGQPLGLEVGRVRSADLRALIPVEPEPLEPIENRLHRLRRGALLIRVFHAQHERAAVAPSVQPVEQGGPGAADVQVTRGRRSKADAWLHGSRAVSRWAKMWES